MFRDSCWDPEGRGGSSSTSTRSSGGPTRRRGSCSPSGAAARPSLRRVPVGGGERRRGWAGTDRSAMRAEVIERLRSTDCCTHLNDGLRSLAEVPVLAAALPGSAISGHARRHERLAERPRGRNIGATAERTGPHAPRAGRGASRPRTSCACCSTRRSSSWSATATPTPPSPTSCARPTSRPAPSTVTSSRRTSCCARSSDGRRRTPAARLQPKVGRGALIPAALDAWIDEILSFGHDRAKAARVKVLGSTAAMKAEGYARRCERAARF